MLPYVFSDHPSFPEGILKRTLEADGFKVGLLEKPNRMDESTFTTIGKPRLFFAIISGPVDSMVLNYTASGKRRKEDLYQTNGHAFFDGCPPSIKYKIRPDRTVILFANLLRRCYKETPIVIGGVEASMRCFAHYDFHDQKIRRSILLDARADLLVTGRGEKQLSVIAKMAQKGVPVKEISIPGTAGIMNKTPDKIQSEIIGAESTTKPNIPINASINHYVRLPSLEQIENEPEQLLIATHLAENAFFHGKGIVQDNNGRQVVSRPPAIYSPGDLERVYGHDYSRLHRGTRQLSPALSMNLFSVTSHRGCGGGCSFCSIALHEGRRVISRPEASILREIEQMMRHPLWKGIVSDIGGPTAEMYGGGCRLNAQHTCKKATCFSSGSGAVCPRFGPGGRYLELLREARRLKGVRKIFLGSGSRFELLLKNPELLEEILVFHSGRFLRVAPEHTQPGVLRLMRKAPYDTFLEFVRLFQEINRKLKRKVQLAPYLIVGHPGETRRDVMEMKRRLQKLKLDTPDVQIFTPTPGTLSTAMYYAEAALHGDGGGSGNRGENNRAESIPVEKDMRELIRRKLLLTGR